jgi:sec-independent protein translocase protein TatA
MLASIAGPDLMIVVAVVVLLFGASQLPKLARSLGSASKEFRQGQREGVVPMARRSPGAPTPAAVTDAAGPRPCGTEPGGK